MQGRDASGARRAFEDALARFPILLPFVVCAAFAAAVCWLHGSEPPLSIDHISYFKLSDEIRAEFTLGDYWRSFNSVRSYGVMLAHLYDLTGSHIASLKLLLAVMSVAYLGAFQIFMGLATRSRARAMLFSLFSALFVSFGASIWGMTDFAASLNRTLIIPFVVLATWFFFRHFSSAWRYAVFPALVLLSLLHLSALHVFLVFGAFELVDFVFRRRLRFDRNLAYFASALMASALMQGVIENVAGGTSGYVRYTLNMAVPSLANVVPFPAPAPAPAKPEAKAPEPAPVEPAPAEIVPIEPPPSPLEPAKKLSNKEAWRIELLAFPWRNFPPSIATMATMAASFGIILLLAVAGAWRASRLGGLTRLDLNMISFAAAAVIVAYGLQILLWILRDLIPVLPINFEEIRSINLIMMPAVYFIHRLYELAPATRRLSRGAVRAAIMIAFALQPILVVRALPASWREGLLEHAVARGVLKTSDAPRMLYARQFLGLASDRTRFYYSSRGAIEWLEKSTGPGDSVLTNLNEFHMSRVKAVGPFLAIVNMDVWDPRRVTWARSLEAIDRALAERDLDRVIELARAVGATYAVVDWAVDAAVYRDRYYSVIRVR